MYDQATLFFDTELALSPDEVGGWDAAKSGAAGLSAAASVAEPGSRVRLYDLHTVDVLADAIDDTDLLVTFNGLGFDLPLIAALAGRSLHPRVHVDLCDVIFRAVGMRHKGWGLDAICRRTLSLGKPVGVNGAFAPVLAKQGRWGELFDYCLGDVYLTKALYEHIVRYKSVIGLDGQEVSVTI